jgi:hyaluronoglucosaminidase
MAAHAQTKSASRDAFRRRGIVEGFFGPPWSMAHRKALFAFGAARGMNTYLYAPKDDPYHRDRWMSPYPAKRWQALEQLIRAAAEHNIDFVYGFHPGKGLCFSADPPIAALLAKATRFYAAGVRTFAVLFDDIPSRLQRPGDRKIFGGSLARAEAEWLARVIAAQPGAWHDVEWWLCPSYYSTDPVLARVFGEFEEGFLETLGTYLPAAVNCLWTGPAVVPKSITLAHLQTIVGRIHRQLIVWDNYPVNDLAMADELHIGPLQGRDPRLSRLASGYLNNPLLQEELSFLPLATCFDYAAAPSAYEHERSWRAAVQERFGAAALPHWRAIREFCEAQLRSKHTGRPLRASPRQVGRWRAVLSYARSQSKQQWTREFKPWFELIRDALR